MNRLVVFSLAVLLAPGGGLSAQPRDSMQQRGDTAEAERLRAQIEQRFSARVQHDLKLTQDQATKLRASQERFSARRRQVMQQQMQPGVAANADSVSKLMDGMRSGRAEMLKIEQDEDREMSGYLTAVQRARYQQMRARLMQRAAEMRMERREGRGMGRGEGMGRGTRAPRRRPI